MMQISPHRQVQRTRQSGSLLRLLAALFVVFLALNSLSIVPSSAQSGSSTSFRITGVVINARDASPIPRCRLTATLSNFNRGGNRQPVEVQSDERGRFALDLPSAGAWRLSAAARNVHAQPYEDHEGFFTGIVLTPTHPTYTVVFRAQLDAVLSGIVIDEAGEAVRNAPVSLISVDATAAQTNSGVKARTQQAMTDDRGHYEFAGLEAGSYLVNVRARPWYALQGGGFAGSGPASATASPDPSLDLVYPVTWYPGTTDDASATPLLAHAGDHLEADFHLLAIPSAHLLLPLTSQQPDPAGNGARGGVPGGFGRGTAQVSLLLPNGSVQQVFGTYTNASSGDLDMGGLAPGTYQVTLPGTSPREPGRTTILHIAAGGTVTEAGSGSTDSSLTLSVDGDTSVNPSQITLIDTATGRTISPGNRRGRPGDSNPNGFQGPQQQRRGQDNPPATPASPRTTVPNTPVAATSPAPAADGPDGLRTLTPTSQTREASHPELPVDLPPGRYEVTVSGNSGAFLTGLTATGAQTEGRFVTIRDASARLVVHLASGLASVEGTATFHGKPCPGAMVLLIPATLGAPTSLAKVHRDQSNTDGSFHLTNVIPGQYILLAIDHGWSVQWNDAATLRPYLLGGSPLDLAPSAAAHSAIEALAP